MLVVLGFGEVVLALVALLLAAMVGGAVAWALWRFRPWERLDSRSVLRPALRALRRGLVTVASAIRRLLSRERHAVTAFRDPAARLAAESLRMCAMATASVRRRGSRRDARGKALRLNATGLDLRRQGEPQQAVDCHRAALRILSELGDERAAALTQNNVALALARAGAEGEAIAEFEQAISVLRQLDEREHEGQVLANLGLIHLRSGRADQAKRLLLVARDKLPPDSAARRKLERHLV